MPYLLSWEISLQADEAGKGENLVPDGHLLMDRIHAAADPLDLFNQSLAAKGRAVPVPAGDKAKCAGPDRIEACNPGIRRETVQPVKHLIDVFLLRLTQFRPVCIGNGL